MWIIVNFVDSHTKQILVKEPCINFCTASSKYFGRSWRLSRVVRMELGYLTTTFNYNVDRGGTSKVDEVQLIGNF